MAKQEKEWIDTFQWFHQHPELGYEEWETTAKIREILQEEGVEILPSGLKTGVIGVVRGKQAGAPRKRICLRADIDALPIAEATQLPYASEYPGRMHACGHDFHITAALEAASVLAEQKETFGGEVYFAFQPAEEVIGGAKMVCATGLLDDIEEFYGFHAEPSLKAGQISIESGSVMAAVDQFSVTITGKGGHAAAPHLSNSPIPVLVSMVNQIQILAAGQINPLFPKVVAITHISAGETWNVIPDSAFFEGTVRSMNQEDREKIRQTILKIVKSYEETTGVLTEVKWHQGPAAVVNDAELSEAARAVCEETGLERISLMPAMLSDDFSEYADSVHGSHSLYVKIGTGIGPTLHSPLFQVDVSAIKTAAAFLAQLLFCRSR
ncbi:MAG: amidohydrolase [bacterium]|nr:amidohydrolase [bacterium]